MEPAVNPNEPVLNITLKTDRARAILSKIARVFPATPEGQMWLGVVTQAVLDALPYRKGRINTFQSVDGRSYLLEKEMEACNLCGVSSSYVRRLLFKAEII